MRSSTLLGPCFRWLDHHYIIIWVWDGDIQFCGLWAGVCAYAVIVNQVWGKVGGKVEDKVVESPGGPLVLRSDHSTSQISVASQLESEAEDQGGGSPQFCIYPFTVDQNRLDRR